VFILRADLDALHASVEQSERRRHPRTDARDIDNRPKSARPPYSFNIQPAMVRPISSGESS
jgi:hypothetical protein